MSNRVNPAAAAVERPSTVQPSHSSTVSSIPSSQENGMRPILTVASKDTASVLSSSSLPPRPPPPVPYVSNPYSIFTVTVQVPVVLLLSNTHCPTLVECPYCHHTVTTITNKVAGSRTCILTAVLIGVCCLVGACVLLFLWDDSKDIVHRCPECHTKLAKHRPPVAARGPARYAWRRADG